MLDAERENGRRRYAGLKVAGLRPCVIGYAERIRGRAGFAAAGANLRPCARTPMRWIARVCGGPPSGEKSQAGRKKSTGAHSKVRDLRATAGPRGKLIRDLQGEAPHPARKRLWGKCRMPNGWAVGKRSCAATTHLAGARSERLRNVMPPTDGDGTKACHCPRDDGVPHLALTGPIPACERGAGKQQYFDFRGTDGLLRFQLAN